MFDGSIFSRSLQESVAICIFALWGVFAIGFFLLRPKADSVSTRREPRAMIGLLLQILGMGLVWGVRRPMTSTSPELPLELAIAVAALSIMIVSVFLSLYAVHILGEHWAVGAQIHTEHRLITRGPYSIIRNPIYSGIMGMLVATGLTISEFYIILPAISIYIVGFVVRIRSEEKLLRETFGSEFDEYCMNVPAIFPRFLTGYFHPK